MKYMENNMIRLTFFIAIFLCLATPTIGQTEQQVPSTEESIEQFLIPSDSPPSYQGALTRMILTLVGLIVLIVLSVWMLRRISQGKMKQLNYGRTIKILERRPLSAKSVLYLVDVGGKQVLIAESQVEVRPITPIDSLHSSQE